MVEYFSFDDVLGELKLQEEELKRMVSEGELRAFRDENKMKFRKDDVESLKKGRVAEATVVLPPGTPSAEDTAPPAPPMAGEETGDTLLAPEPAGEILEPAPAGGMGDLDLSPDAAPAVADAGETVAGETTGITEQMVFEDTDLTVAATDGTTGTAIESQETFVDEEEAARTEPLQISEEKPAGEEEEEASRARAARRGMAIAAAPPKAESHPILNIALFVGIVIVFLAGIIGLDAARIAQQEADPEIATGLTKEVSKMIEGIMIDPTKLPPK